MRDKEPEAQLKPWVPIKIEVVGKLTETILGGTGKNSPGTFDSGDPRKPPGRN